MLQTKQRSLQTTLRENNCNNQQTLEEPDYIGEELSSVYDVNLKTLQKLTVGSWSNGVLVATRQHHRKEELQKMQVAK